MSCGACSVRWGRFIRCCTSCTCREVRWVRASWCVRSSCGLRRCAAAGCGSRDGGMHRYPRQFGSLITVFEVKLKKWESKCQKHVPVKGLGSLPPCSANNTKPEAGSVVAVAFRGLNAAASVSLLRGPFEASPGLCRSRYSWIPAAAFAFSSQSRGFAPCGRSGSGARGGFDSVAALRSCVGTAPRVCKEGNLADRAAGKPAPAPARGQPERGCSRSLRMAEQRQGLVRSAAPCLVLWGLGSCTPRPDPKPRDPSGRR